MNIVAMIQHLQELVDQCGPDQIVRAWCPEGESYYPVTGVVYGGDGVFVDLYTDSDDEEQANEQ